MAVLFASLLRSFTGFGFALAAVPVFSLFLLPIDVVVLSASLALALGVISLPSYRGITPIRELVPLLVMAVPGTILGAGLLSLMSVSQFQLLVGLSVLFACVGIRQSRPTKSQHSPLLGGVVGFCSGLLNGAVATPGPPVIVYALLTQSEPQRSRALMMSFFSASALLAVVTHGVRGSITLPILSYFFLALPVLYFGEKLGKMLFQRFGESFYRRVALLALAVLGVVITLRGLL